jgi:hypothetical protein
MLQARRIEIREDPIEWAGHSVTLVSRSWLLTAGVRSVGLGGQYRRPLYVEVTGQSPGRVPIRDHVMVSRLAGAALHLIAAVLRRIR